QRHTGGDASHTGIPRGAAPPDAFRRRVPLAGARDRRGFLRNAADADANGDGRSTARGVRTAPPRARVGAVSGSRGRASCWFVKRGKEAGAHLRKSVAKFRDLRMTP